jgi:hypothetical protein
MVLPSELSEYHTSGAALSRKLDVSPWLCEFWPVAEVETWNERYEVPRNAPGYIGFGTSGGGEMYAFSPRGAIVCLAFIGMSPHDELQVATSWEVFKGMLRDAV